MTYELQYWWVIGVMSVLLWYIVCSVLPVHQEQVVLRNWVECRGVSGGIGRSKESWGKLGELLW